MCRSYRGSTGAARGGLGILGDRRNIGGLLEFVGVLCGQRNLGVSRRRKCTVHVVCFSGDLGVFMDSVG